MLGGLRSLRPPPERRSIGPVVIDITPHPIIKLERDVTAGLEVADEGDIVDRVLADLAFGHGRWGFSRLLFA
jgi:hypothetical protein